MHLVGEHYYYGVPSVSKYIKYIKNKNHWSLCDLQMVVYKVTW